MTASNKIQFFAVVSVLDLFLQIVATYHPTNVYNSMNFFQKGVALLSSISIGCMIINPLIATHELKIDELYFQVSASELQSNQYYQKNTELFDTIMKTECQKKYNSTLLKKDGMVVCYR